MHKDPYTVDYSQRVFDNQIHPLIARRWSPRSFKKQRLEPETIHTLIEAVRWSPSAFNMQPWRIIATENGSEKFDEFLTLLVDRNKPWAENASLLGFFVAKLFNDKKSPAGVTVTFDTGFAWAALTFQARSMGLYTHCMAGIHYDDAYDLLGINREQYVVIAGFVVGVLDTKEKLHEQYRQFEHPHGDRNKAEDFLFLDSTGDLQ